MSSGIDGNDKNNGLYGSVETRAERERRWAREGERPLWRNLSMIGALGWLIVTPTLIGALLGRWLDETYGRGVFWTGSLIFAGAAVGFYLAWQKIESDR
jgi:ATP synthase protein I